MIVLDASVLIALLNPVDAHHDRAAALLTEHADSGFGLHTVTLAEVLVGAVRAGRGNQLLADLRALGIAVVTPPAEGPGESEPMLLAEIRATTGLKMPDCCVMVVALRESALILTFDSRLAEAATALGLPGCRVAANTEAV